MLETVGTTVLCPCDPSRSTLQRFPTGSLGGQLGPRALRNEMMRRAAACGVAAILVVTAWATTTTLPAGGSAVKFEVRQLRGTTPRRRCSRSHGCTSAWRDNVPTTLSSKSRMLCHSLTLLVIVRLL